MKLNTKDFEARMDKAIAALNSNFDTVRAGQASAAVLNRVTFEYYGAQTPIKDMADIRQADSRTLEIKPYDGSTLKAMEKAILASDVGITPNNDGQVIRLAFPQLSEERRKELCMQVQKLGEEAKVAVRNQRRDALDKLKSLKKGNTITEDDEADGEKKIQNLTDKFCKEIDELASAKEKEIMEI